jgi:hypothetical protein
MTALSIPRSAFRRPALVTLRALTTWPAYVIYVYLASRVVSSAFLLIAMAHADPSGVGANDSFIGALTDWDAVWYRRIAEQGYPSELPVIGSSVQNNAWAFMPLYPKLVKLLILGQMGAYPLAAVLVSAFFGAAAAVMLVPLVRPHVGHRAAMITAAIFSLGPTSFILQTGYAESLGLFLLFAFLCLVDRSRYGAAALVALPLTFARPGMQAVALFVFLHLCVRLVQSRRSGKPMTRREWVVPLALSGLTGLLGFVWPFLAGMVTGVKDAYLLTELSWRVGYGFDPVHLTYFLPWIRGAVLFFGAPAGPVILGIVLVLGAALVFLPSVRRAGSTVRLWYVSYVLYMLAIFFPQSSTLRLLMPVSPIAAPLGRLAAWQVAVVLAVCVTVQGLLVWNVYGGPFGMLSTP